MAAEIVIPETQLPLWMRQARRGIDWGMLVILALSLTSAWGFINDAGLPRTNDSERYVFRTADTAAALREGRLYPRWSPHALAGYGAPIPHYYPPGAPYSAALITIFLTGSQVSAVRVLYLLAFCLGGVGMYALVTRRSGAAVGLIAMLLYTGSPYIGQTAPHVQGDLSGLLGLTLVIALLWAADRALHDDRPFNLAFVAGATAAVILTDWRGALIALLLTLLLTLWQRRVDARARWRMVAVGVGLGIGLASFYWLPALLELDAVTWRQPDVRPFDRLSFPDIVQPLRQLDPAALVPTPHFTIGATGLIALIGGGLALRDRGQIDFHGLFWLTGVVTLVAAVLIAPGQTWLLGSATLCLAIGGSALWSLNRIDDPGSRRLLLPALVIGLLFAAQPIWLTQRPPDQPRSFTPAAQVDYELQGNGVAVLPANAPVPVTTTDRLDPNGALRHSYETGTLMKVSGEQITGMAQVGALMTATHSIELQVNTTTTTTITILTAHFPGWVATLNDRPVPLSRDPLTGLIRVSLPAGAEGDLRLTLGPTPSRTGAWIISGALLGLLAVVTWGRVRRTDETFVDLHLLDNESTRLVLLVVGLFFVVVMVIAPLPQLHPPPGFGLDNRQALRYRSNVGLEALAYDLPGATYRPGDAVEFTVYWHTLRDLTANYRVRGILIQVDPGMFLPPTPLRHPGGYPTRRWLTDRYVADPYRIPIPADVAPGQYLIGLEVFDCDQSCDNAPRLTFFADDGTQIGSVIVLPPVVTIAN